MCAQSASYEQRGHIADQLHELYRLLANGTRPSYLYRKPIQELIEGKIEQFLFTHPAVQLQLMLEWSRQRGGWGISQEEFMARLEDMPEPVADGLKAVVLVPSLVGTDGFSTPELTRSGPERTLQELLAVGALEEAGMHQDVEIRCAKNHSIGLRWETLDLGTVPEGTAPTGQTEAPYAAVAAAAVLHPNWMRLVNGREIPYPLLPGCQCDPYERGEPDSLVFTGPKWTPGTELRLNLRPLYTMPHGPKVSIPELVTD